MGGGSIGKGGSSSLGQEVESLRRRVAELEAAASTNPPDEQQVHWNHNLTPFDDAPLGLAYFGADLRYLYINRWLALRNGLSTAAHIGKRVAETLPEGAAGVEQQLRQVATTGQPIVAGTVRTETAVHPGVIRDYEHYYYPHSDADGTIAGVSSVVLDVTGRKTDEQRRADDLVRDLVEAAPDSIVVTSDEGRIVLANQQAARLFGYTQAEFAELSIDQLLPDRFRADHDNHRKDDAGAPSLRPMGRRGVTLVGLRKSGEEFPAEINLGPLQTHDGLRVVSVIRDVSDKRRLEAEATRHRAALAHVTRVASLGGLQAALAHELNQPLTAILSNAQAATRFLDHDPPDVGELQAILSDIIDDDRRASEVIKHLRAMLAKREPTAEVIDLKQLLGDTMRLLQNDLLLKDVTGRIELEDTPPRARIMGDPIQVQQIVLNLILNGADAVAEQADQERSVTVLSQHDESHVTVSVRDSGHGIAESHLATLFEPFETSKPSGLGMGLTVCRTLVEAHGGHIWVAETSSTGTTVCFTLPIDRSEVP